MQEYANMTFYLDNRNSGAADRLMQNKREIPHLRHQHMTGHRGGGL